MYTPEFVKRGTLPTIGGSCKLRRNGVHTFTLNVDGGSALWQRFDKDWRVVIYDEGRRLLSGAPLKIVEKASGGVVESELTGESDMTWLKDMITLPTPSRAADKQGADAYWNRKGSAGALIRDLVDVNVGPSARSEYRRPLVIGDVVTGPDGSINSRFKPVLDEVETLAETAGLTVDIVQDDVLKKSVLTVTEGRDFARRIRLTHENGGIESHEFTLEAPTVTSVLVAGQGEGAERTLKLTHGNENSWGFRSLQFQDRRDTDDEAELDAAGTDTITEGQEKATVNLQVNDTPRIRFGRDFWLGDTVTVQLSTGVVITDTVQMAELTWDENGRKVALQVGPTADDENQPRPVKEINKLWRAVRALQTR
ncbi:Gp37-like protein [Brevibacterium sp. H602]|uniref:Gp37-like protein n=1 Tax=Brevibacterium sp. H602 TaxID=3444316 RepID=UPI003EC0FEF0